MKDHYHKSLILDGTGFNVGYWAGHSEDQFISECVKDGVFGDKENRIELLKLAYSLISDITRTTEENDRV